MSIYHKLFSRKGETLTETLVALLIVGLSSVVLASMIGAASRMGTQAAEQDKALRKEISVAEERTGGTKGRLTVAVNGNEETFEVEYFGSEQQIHSYMYKK